MRRKLAVCCDLWRTLRQQREVFSFNFQLFVSFLFGVFACSNSFTQEIFISNHSFFFIFFLFQTSTFCFLSDRAQSKKGRKGGNGEGAAMYRRDFASETRALRNTTFAGATHAHQDSRSCCPAPAPAGPRAGSVESGALPASNESGEVLGTEVGGGDGSAAARGLIAGPWR